MSASTTRAPAWARVTAAWRPMPMAAPVTTAVRPSSEKAATMSGWTVAWVSAAWAPRSPR